jgi:hypothetical protein
MDCFNHDFEIYPFSAACLQADGLNSTATKGINSIADPQVALTLIRETFLGVVKRRPPAEKAREVHVDFVSATDTQSFRGKCIPKNPELKSTDIILNTQICGMKLADSYRVDVYYLACIDRM